VQTHKVEVVTLAERPELFDAAFGFPYADHDGSVFMQGSMVATLTSATRLARLWPGCVLVLLDNDRVVARAVCVPFASTRTDRTPYPDGGWDQVSIWAVEDALDGIEPDVLCALEIAVDPSRRGAGLAAAALEAMKANARRLGFHRLVAPLRPPGKARYPSMAIDAYCARTREDGLPEDWWLRLHTRAGGRQVGLAYCSGTVQAPLTRWREWTGLAFDTDGEVAVRGGLAPVFVSVSQGIGVYVEPNVWFEYNL
jgi:GNAT superfamily N-acetyltransferase